MFYHHYKPGSILSMCVIIKSVKYPNQFNCIYRKSHEEELITKEHLEPHVSTLAKVVQSF